GCWEWDPASGRISWSDELYRIYGVERERFTPSFEGYLERVHPDDREQARSTVARALTEGRGFIFDERIVRPGGELRYLRSRGEVVRDDQGRSLKVLGTCLDITEQKSAEAALRAAAANLQALTRRLVEAEEAERRRIAQEALNNVAKHAGARQVRIELAGEAEEVVMRVADDGAGFDPAAAARGKRWGMKTMRERAEAAGGRLEVDSAPGDGTTVRAS